jgi:hypothetical protein
VNGEEKKTEEPKQLPFFAVEDGITFLSRKDLDDYREQKIMLAWQEGAYV